MSSFFSGSSLTFNQIVPSGRGKRAVSTLFLIVALIALASFTLVTSPARAVTGVSCSDTDTTGPGLDMRDVTCSWTPGTAPAGFTGTEIFILPNTTTVAAGTVKSTACGGAACSFIGFFGQQTQNTFTGVQVNINDSAGTALSASTTYKGCVFTDATTDALDCSAGFMVTSDTVTDTVKPHVDHISVNHLVAGADAPIAVIFKDDQTTAAQFNDTGDGGAELAQICHGTNLQTAETCTNCTRTSGTLFGCTVPQASVPAQGQLLQLQYYITAKDRANNQTFFCNNPTATTAAACKSSPFTVTVAAAGSRTVAGTISSGGTGLANARVFAAGAAVAPVQANGSGVYTLTGLPNNSAFDIVATLASYCENKRFETIGTANLSSINLTLNAGECAPPPPPAGGAPGGGGKPHVTFSSPPENPPTERNFRVGLDRALDPARVNDADPTNAGSSVYLTSNGTDRVGGTVTYCPNSSAAGCSALFAQDQNVILFSAAADLTANTLYTLVITEGVYDTAGQTIEGNRPGGGHELQLRAQGAAIGTPQLTTSFGTTSAFMPPFVQSAIPAPGITAPPNVKPVLAFNTRMGTNTLTNTNITLTKVGGAAQTITVSVDQNSGEIVTITPASALAAGEYEIQVKGAVADSGGVTMRPPDQASGNAFTSRFVVGGSTDVTPPTIYPANASGATGVAVNSGKIDFGANEALDPGTITTSNVTISRGASSVSATVQYDPGTNTISLLPYTVLAPNTNYTVTLGTGVKDAQGVALTAAQTFAFTTGSADSTAPAGVRETRCSDTSCTVFFPEAMRHDSPTGNNYASSVLNPANFTLTQNSVNVSLAGKVVTYDAVENSATITGLALTRDATFALTAGDLVTDLSGNRISTTSGVNTFTSKVEGPQNGGFTAGAGMFGPPPTGLTGGAIGGEFKPQGFGNFTADNRAFGQSCDAFPFNHTAGQDSNVFQVRCTLGVAVANGDQIVLTFPTGTSVANAAPDTFSPWFADMNQFAPGTVAFDTNFDTDGVQFDIAARTVTIQLAVSSGTPGANDQYVFDLKKLTNPAIPKGPDTGGYTVGLKLKRAGTVQTTKTTTPYFIDAGGSRSITVNITTVSPANGQDGSIFLFGGGPAGPINKNVTLTNGIISAVDGTVAANVQLSSLNDGCYFVGTDSTVTLGGVDYFGQVLPDPICVNASNASPTKNIVLTSAQAAGVSVALTVKLGTANFGGKDVDIFAGGPGRFVKKTISALGVPDPNGYTLRLPANGTYFVGWGPAMSKTTGGFTAPLAVSPPPPAEIIVAGLPTSGTISAGRNLSGATFNSTTNTLTFVAESANKAISGTVTDGTSGLSNVQVFAHSGAFGAPAFATTKSDGTFTLNVAKFGHYAIGAFSDGLPPANYSIEVRPDGSDADNDPDIFFKGKQITGTNPLVIRLKKASFTISGKVQDGSNNAVGGVPVVATDANGNSVHGMTLSDGSYIVYVDAGTWTLRAELPPDKTDTCGSYSKTVTVTTESKSSQNITPSVSTCLTLSGTITMGGAVAGARPVGVMEWDTTNSRPAAGGFFRPTSTNSSGVYSVNVAGNKTYRVCLFDPTSGEICTDQAVVTSNVTNADITSTIASITFAFTGGTAAMDAFIEVRSTADKDRRVGTTVKGLSTNPVLTVPSGSYNYFVDVFGVGKFNGAVATGATATVDLSTTTLITVSGNVNDNAGSDLAGALVQLKSSTGAITTATADSSGNYSVKVKTGSYTVNASASNYVSAPSTATVSLTADTTNYDFGGGAPDQSALAKSTQVITGTISKSDMAAATSGIVMATNSSTGAVVTAAVDPQNGTYALPVTDGTWTVKAAAPLHAKSTGTNVPVAATDVTQNITLTADATRVPAASSTSLAADVGGTIDDRDSTGIKITAPAGVLTTGPADVTIEVEKTFTAPETATARPLGDATFEITAEVGNTAVKDLTGNVDIQLDYGSLVSQLPAGVSESNLQLVYYSDEQDEYVPVEGGFTVDTTNNIISGQVDHFTEFMIVYSPVTVAQQVGSSVSDLTPPAAATNVRLTSNGTSVTATWTDPADSDFYRIVVLRNDGGTTPVTGDIRAIVAKGEQRYVDTSVTAGTTYKYILKSQDTALNQRLTEELSVTVAATATTGGGGGGTTSGSGTTTPPPASSTPPATTTTPPAASTQATTAAPVARLIHDPSKLTELLSGLGVIRSQSEEAKYMPLIKSDAIAFRVDLTAEQETTLTNFISYGHSAATVKLGAGERRAVLRDYLETVGRGNVNFEDVERMTKGEKPVARNLDKERAQVGVALKIFVKIYGHSPNFQVAEEDLAWNTLLYRVRFTRDLTKERTGIAEYRAMFGRTPRSPMDWATVRVLGYVQY